VFAYLWNFTGQNHRIDLLQFSDALRSSNADSASGEACLLFVDNLF
jgi:hypothetical protein